MGYLKAIDAIENTPNLDVALHLHLRSNLYPPQPTVLIPACKRAVLKARRGEWSRSVRLPNNKLVKVHTLVNGLRLDAFVEYEGEI